MSCSLRTREGARTREREGKQKRKRARARERGGKCARERENTSRRQKTILLARNKLQLHAVGFCVCVCVFLCECVCSHMFIMSAHYNKHTIHRRDPPPPAPHFTISFCACGMPKDVRVCCACIYEMHLQGCI